MCYAYLLFFNAIAFTHQRKSRYQKLLRMCRFHEKLCLYVCVCVIYMYVCIACILKMYYIIKMACTKCTMYNMLEVIWNEYLMTKKRRFEFTWNDCILTCEVL